MLKVDKAIFDTDKVISKNIAFFDATERGLLSQNILAQLRNYVEYIVQKEYSQGADTDPNDYPNKKDAWEYVKTKGQLRFLSKFHLLLQKSVSHYTVDEDGSERLMLKYYEYLIKIKKHLKSKYNMDVLCNIDDFPLSLDTNLSEYYKKISERIKEPSQAFKYDTFNDRLYIRKIKPFFVNHEIFYEVTFTIADDKVSKFDRIIAFTKLDIPNNYAVKLTMHDDLIDVIGTQMPIKIIDDYEVSIRPCEFNKFAKICGRCEVEVRSNQHEYQDLMRFLTFSQMNLVDLVTSSDDYYSRIKNECTKRAKTIAIFPVLEFVRVIVNGNYVGANVIRYLLYKMKNDIIKSQLADDQCDFLSDLYLAWGCKPFDVMPFTTALMNHNPRLYDLFDCIDSTGREHELLARKVNSNTEQRGILFTPITDLSGYGNLEELINSYNDKLYYKHNNRKLLMYKDHLYIKGFADNTANILKRLIELSSEGIDDYTIKVDSWLNNHSEYKIDSIEKLNALKSMFVHSYVALIYGSAGTGKSTMINHISNLFNNKKKLYLANTNPAVDNLKQRVTAESSNCSFKTIRRFLSEKYSCISYDVLIIDECSTVSNEDMINILNKASFTVLVLSGDVFQIESIRFGNWFSIARQFVNSASVIELTKPFRSTNDNLITVWNRVRNLDDSILEPMVKAEYTHNLDDTIFQRFDDDEIVLCLNYDGLYGINNINRLLQSNNTNNVFVWGVNNYKINDPILFNESERFTPWIHNNMKGRIVDIELFEKKIRFDIELDCVLNEKEVFLEDLEFVGLSKNNHSIVRFYVEKYKSTDEDDESSKAIVPFQVAYAVSIHKAQGLEYNSVKIVITKEVEEMITHNIFYTAITRAKEKLKIYWSPETEKTVLEGLSKKSYNKDANLIASLYGL